MGSDQHLAKDGKSGKLYGGRIRVIVLGLIRSGDQILVSQGYDEVKGQTFYRPLGGGVDHGESTREALLREFKEELGVDLVDVRLLTVLENVFTYNGRRGHEIVFVYEAAFADQTLYEQEELRAYEHGVKGDFPAIWKPVADFVEGGEILYSTGIVELLAS